MRIQAKIAALIFTVCVLSDLLPLARLTLCAQVMPRIIRLKATDAQLGEEFTSVDYVRELSDGRVLVVDQHENRLVVANFAKGTVETISRSGSGPGEIRSITKLFALAGDSTLLVDDANRRWLLLSGTRIVTTLRPDAPATVAAHRGEWGVDHAGHILAQFIVGGIPGDRLGRLDSPYVALVSRRTGKADTIGRIRPAMRFQVAATYAPDGTLASANYRFAPLTAFEQVAIFPDGWIAIARLEPYRIDWRSPDGRWIHGPPVSIPPVNVDDPEKRAYLVRTSAGQGAPPDPSTISNWPETIPPFESRGSIVLPATDGTLLVRRTPTARHEETLYDLFDRRGARTSQLSLPKNARIVGFGMRTVFVVITDDDGIQRLHRHPWP